MNTNVTDNKKITCTATEYNWMTAKLANLESRRSFGTSFAPGSIAHKATETRLKQIEFLKSCLDTFEVTASEDEEPALSDEFKSTLISLGMPAPLF